MNGAVCIILVNFHGHNDTIECLESVMKSNYANYQIVVVDNSLNEESMRHIESWALGEWKGPVQTHFPELVYPLEPVPINFKRFSEREFLALERRPTERVLLVRADHNYGFAGGNNLALRYVLKNDEFNFAWLLNNDTVIQKDCLSSLVSCSTNGLPQIGIFGGKLFDYYNKERLQGVGGKYFHWFGKIREIGGGELDRGQWDKETPALDYVIGASMFVKRPFLESVGLMEEDYFLYYEELDWAIRGARKQWRMGFCPEAVVFHKLGASTGSGKKGTSEISDFYSIRNRIKIAKRFFPLTLITLYAGFLLFVVNRIKVRKHDRIKILFRVLKNPDRHYALR